MTRTCIIISNKVGVYL